MPVKQVVMYGIPNCNTIKKARQWLESNNVDYEFHDYKKKGVDAQQLKTWIEAYGWDKIVNTRGMTWCKLDEETRTHMNAESAIPILMEKTSMIKRPILETAKTTLIGFDEATYQQTFIA